MMRDKRVVNAAFVAPVFMIVLFILLFGFIEEKVSKRPDLRLAFVRDVSNPMIDAAQKAQGVNVSIVESLGDGLALLKDGKEVGKMAEDWKGLSDSGQRLTLARLIDTRPLPLGEYEVAIRIRDRVTGQSLSPSQKFSVVQ